MLQSFIVKHYLNKNVDIYYGETTIIVGTVVACVDGTLTVEKDDRYTHIAIDKITAIRSRE